jgi:REP element-mobilizing transposase RayT
MGRKLRYIPDGGALVEVTCRTLQGRLLLRPSPELNDITAGILGRTQRLYPVDIVAFQALSNHYHALLFVKSAKRLAEFAGYLNSNLAREVGRLTGWTGKVWGKRYQAIPISDEEEAQVARLKYVLSHGVKENLEARLRESRVSTASARSWTASRSPAPGSTAPKSTRLAAGGERTPIRSSTRAPRP